MCHNVHSQAEAAIVGGRPHTFGQLNLTTLEERYNVRMSRFVLTSASIRPQSFPPHRTQVTNTHLKEAARRVS
ncbi:hypothetical protein J2Z66_000418 [Paenibacillus eucommiae]|uniref:Uncharacterized protein n=2 Tax=Paenibacillus eucommiae TaxID=1355755 RepID=A0ABS4IMM0_9BACL|nr:hypothetical protein [Paenibacillus eucommiae]